jgi:hypothetical protein
MLDQMTVSREQTRKMGEFSREKIASWSFEAVCRSFEENIPLKTRN